MPDKGENDERRTITAVKGILAIIAFWYMFTAIHAYAEHIREVRFSGVGLDRFMITYGLEILIPLIFLIWVGYSYLPPERKIRLTVGAN